MNESIPDDNENVLPYPLYYVGTTSRDYQMACFVLGNNSVTIQEMHAVFSQDGAADNEDTKIDIGSSLIGSIG
jgi:hypothetical protein